MNEIHKIFRLLLALGLALPAFVLAGQPDWIAGDPSEYPNSQYLIGRGVGSTEVEAQDRARGDLATIFEVRIQVANESTITAARSDNKEQVSRLNSQQVSAKTDKVISGISIANIWRDPVTMDFHALAVLPRAQAAASLGEELDKIDKELQQELQTSKDAADPLLKIGTLNKALQASIRREGYQAMLKVVDPSGRGVQAQTSQATVQQLIDDAVKQIRIAPEVAEDAGTKEFASLLKGGLASAGFLASKSAEADLILEGRLTLTDLGRREGWNWMRATVQVSLVEKDSRRVRGSQTWPVKTSAQDAQTARTRVLIEVEKLLKQNLRTAIIGFAN
jgi:LPP20 lipoprotein